MNTSAIFDNRGTSNLRTIGIIVKKFNRKKDVLVLNQLLLIDSLNETQLLEGGELKQPRKRVQISTPPNNKINQNINVINTFRILNFSIAISI